jgi:SET domain-containing protein
MLYLKESLLPGAGKGLFTDSEIKKGEIIIEYIGTVRTWAECNKRVEINEVMGSYIFYINSKYCIDAYDALDELARYANDASGYSRVKGLKNNSIYETKKKRVFIVADRKIKAGEEIFVSYGKDYWKQVKENAEIEKQNILDTEKKLLATH